MAISKYDEIMLRLLRVLSDGQTHTKREVTDKMADQSIASLTATKVRIAENSLQALSCRSYRAFAPKQAPVSIQLIIHLRS